MSAHVGTLTQTSQQANDRDLIAKVARGDEEAFSALYDRLSGPLYSLAYKMLGDAGEAQDALQDICLQLWRRAAAYEATKSSVFSWAVLITRGRVIDRLRSRSRRSRIVAASTDDETVTTEPSDASTPSTGADTVASHEQAARVRQVLARLPQDQREAIELAFFSDLTHQEVAERLSQPLGTIKARIRRGMLKLREHLRVQT